MESKLAEAAARLRENYEKEHAKKKSRVIQMTDKKAPAAKKRTGRYIEYQTTLGDVEFKRKIFIPCDTTLNYKERLAKRMKQIKKKR
jgi:hypothetical protein